MPTKIIVVARKPLDPVKFNPQVTPAEPANVLVLENQQRTHRVNTPLLRQITTAVLTDWLGETHYEICFHLVSAKAMARVNEQFLQHTGSTDVITFDHRESADDIYLYGEIFISVADAERQAKLFHTTWTEELTRYVIHGLLHLEGYDDLQPAKRRVMKREENRLVRKAKSQFDLGRLQLQTKCKV